jgi:hypothetical protein
MKISKKRLRQIIREEKARLSSDFTKVTLNEARFGAGSIGFADWSVNSTPNFAKAYGKDARVIGTYGNNNNDLTEQPMPAPSADPKENAFQTLKFGGAFKDLQEMMHDMNIQISAWQDKHEAVLLDAGMEDVGQDLEDARLAVDDLRQLANQLR